MKIFEFIVNLFKKKKPVDGIESVKNLRALFPEGMEERVCLDNFIKLFFKGEIKLIHIPQTEPKGVPQTGEHQVWENQLANQKVSPLQYYYPTSLNDPKDPMSVVRILQLALASNLKTKAAGSGHSYSDVATTTDLFINTHGLNRVASLDRPIAGQLKAEQLRSKLPLALGVQNWPNYDPANNHALIELEGGARLRDLNVVLDARRLGLPNMGGYDGQTFVGAMSTSTHGTGLGLGPFPDSVRSLVLATTGHYVGTTVGGTATPNAGVFLYRIEPSDGITDPAKYDDPEIALIQDDDVFYATIVSMGCFGVIYSVVIEVMQQYWLEEVRELTTLDKVMAMLKPNPNNAGSVPDVLLNNRHFEFLVHPYPMQGGKVIDMDPNVAPETYYPLFGVIAERWNIVPEPDNPKHRSSHRNYLTNFLSKFLLSFDVVATVMNFCPKMIPHFINSSMKSLEDNNYINVSHKIFVNGMDQYAGFATEIGFPVVDATETYTDQYFKKAIDTIHRDAQNNRISGAQYQTSPFAVRFVKKSNAFLSMMHETNTCMIELDLGSDTYGGYEILNRFQRHMYPLSGRPHWGLEFDQLTGSNDLIAALYPKLADWKKVYQQFNAKGTFDSPFTDRVGFSKAEYKPK